MLHIQAMNTVGGGQRGQRIKLFSLEICTCKYVYDVREEI